MKTLPLSDASNPPPRYVYALLDEGLNVRYVGQSFNPSQRVWLHWTNARSRGHADRNSRIFQWMRSLSAVPAWVILQDVPAEEIDAAEQRWIDFFREIHGSDLLNVRPGEWATEEWRAKVSAALRGHGLTPEGRERIRQRRLGRPVSAETREKISRANKGRVYSEERNRKISEALRGRPHPWNSRDRSPETRRKLADAQRGRKHSAETRAKLSAIAKHRYHSEPITGCVLCAAQT